MGENGANEGGQLIPDLPEELVLAHIIPRLPWYTRPLCRVLSRSWRARLDIRNPELDLRTRMFQLPLLRDLFLFCTFDKQVFIRDHDIHEPFQINAYQIQPHWRKLPPLQNLVMPPPALAAMVVSSGMVYVWSVNKRSGREGANFVLKLDMGCAEWTWKKLPVPYAFNSDAVIFNDKIYVPRISLRSSTDASSQKQAVLVLDMATGECTQVETWNQDDLRVVSKIADSNVLVEEMYSFLEEGEKIKVMMYEVATDSWQFIEKVPIPGFQWSTLSHLKLVNSECFEPPEIGINIVWMVHESDFIYWFNSLVGLPWAEIRYNTFLEGKYLEFIQFIRGSLYGIFCEYEEEEQEDFEEDEGGEGLSIRQMRVIMKGRIMVASRSVAWEEVHEIGVFEKRYHVDCSLIGPINTYTMMA